jgi:hypothetical protein
MIPALRRVMRKEDHEFKAHLGFTVSSRPAWGYIDRPVSKNKAKQTNK